MSKLDSWVVLLGLPLTAICASCQRGDKWDLVPVDGTITQAGRPLADVEVVFWTDIEAGAHGPPTSGITDANGRYELRTHGGDKGAAAGLYRVCVITLSNLDDAPSIVGSTEKQSKFPRKGAAEPRRKRMAGVPQIFGRFDKTPLRAEVKPNGHLRLDFDIPDLPLRRKTQKNP